MSDLGNKQIMAENLKRYLDIKNKTAAELCKELDIKKAAFSTWINAKAYPRIDKIELMSNYFNCTKADLVEKYDEEITRLASETYWNIKLNEIIMDFNDEQMEKLCDYAELLALKK